MILSILLCNMNNRAIALIWFAAFNEHDLEKLLSLYDENATHYSPKLKIHQPETAWYWHKGEYFKKSGKIMSMDQMRYTWGSESIESKDSKQHNFIQ